MATAVPLVPVAPASVEDPFRLDVQLLTMSDVAPLSPASDDSCASTCSSGSCVSKAL